MKVEKLESAMKKEFPPFTITITIENEEELVSLWHRTNLAPGTIKKERSSGAFYTADIPDIVTGSRGSAQELWRVLDKERRLRNIKR